MSLPISFLMDIIASKRRDKNDPKPHSWKEHMLPVYRKAKQVRDMFKSGMWTRKKRAAYRKENVHKDGKKQPANWRDQRFKISYPGMEGIHGVLKEPVKMHISDRHPECFPRDTFYTMKNPNKVTLGYDGGHHADKSDLPNLRVNLYKEVDKHTDGTPCIMKVPAKPIKSKKGVIHYHARTGHSVKHSNNPNEFPLDMDKVNEAADHNRRKKLNTEFEKHDVDYCEEEGLRVPTELTVIEEDSDGLNYEVDADEYFDAVEWYKRKMPNGEWKIVGFNIFDLDDPSDAVKYGNYLTETLGWPIDESRTLIMRAVNYQG